MITKLDEYASPVEVYQRRTNAAARTVSSAGDNIVHTPASGRFVLLEYVCLSADALNTAPVIATIKWNGGADLYKLSLVPGAIWARNIGAGRKVVTGGQDQALVVSLSAAQNVYYSEESEEY